jgi:SnoaL-like protein
MKLFEPLNWITSAFERERECVRQGTLLIRNDHLVLTERRAELIREGIQAWNDEGPLAFEPFMAEDIVWTSPDEIPGGGTFHGREATMEFLRSWLAGGGVLDTRLDIAEMLPVGENVLLTLDSEIVGESSGVALPPFQWYMVLRFGEDDLLVRNTVFLDQAKAVEAAGLEQ